MINGNNKEKYRKLLARLFRVIKSHYFNNHLPKLTLLLLIINTNITKLKSLNSFLREAFFLNK